MDVKPAFLNGRLNEDVYMVQPEGFVNPKHPRQVCKLQRSIYRLKQASRRWNKRFDEEIKRYGFTQNPNEPYVYKKASGSIIVFLILYVDDILLMGNNIPMLQDVKSWLGKCFAMKDLGEAAYILGIKIYLDRLRRLIGLSQNAYIDKTLKGFRMDTSKRGTILMQPNVDLSNTQGPSTPAEVKRMKGIPYASTVGSAMYTVRCTDVANTKDMFLVYGGDSTTKLGVTCYINASWETDRDDLRSQMRFVFVMNGGAINWKSSKQSTTAMSSIEAEYIAAVEAVMEAIWICKFIYGLGIVPNIDRPMDMYCDNTSAITIADEPGVQRGAKHFRRKYHFIREAILEGDIRILKVHIDDNLADPFTKPMPCTKYVEHARSIGLKAAGFFKSEIENVGTKSRATRPFVGQHTVCRVAGRSSMESFYWTLCLRSLLDFCLAVGLRSSSYLHYNLISGLGSLNNQISSTQDASSLDPDTGFFVLKINFAYSFLLLLFSCTWLQFY
ncbi:retrotransposon protein, putative, ty1-copia subclass [Tanacetum coccineum]